MSPESEAGSKMSHARRWIVASALLLFSAPLFAQLPAPVRDSIARRQSIVAPAFPPSTTVIHRTVAAAVTARLDTLTVSRLARPWSFDEGSHTAGTAMMIVGGLGVIAGTVVGGKAGPIITISGGVLGLAGLWIYAK